MQQIEPTGATRVEWYLAQLVANTRTAFTGVHVDWRTLLIGYEEHEQTLEEAYAAFERFG